MAPISPGAKIVLYLLLVVTVFLSGSMKMTALIFFCVAPFTIIVPFRMLRRGIIPVMFFLVFTFLSNVLFQKGTPSHEILGLQITDEGLYRGGHLTLRLFILILGARILTATTEAEALVTGMRGLLGPLSKVGFLNELIMTISLTLRLLPVVYKEAGGLYREVRDSRGTGLAGRIRLAVSLLAPLFERSLEKAKKMNDGQEQI